jgi:hypothetical protein
LLSKNGISNYQFPIFKQTPMTKILKIQIIILLFALYFLFSYSPVKAAKLEIISPVEEFGLDKEFQVDVILDTEGQSINAIEGRILFPLDLLDLEEIKDGDSIVNLWLERPSIKTENLIIFSGVIPGGFEGVLSPYYEGYRPGKVFSLIFVTKSLGEGTIEAKDLKALLHDGLGTPAKTSISHFSFKIQEKVKEEALIEKLEDNDPSESFEPIIAQDPQVFDGKYFLVFATQDKGSGILHYEILEEEPRGSVWGLVKKEKWQVGESPYVLKDQKLKSHIYVKAIDRAGNERIATLAPQVPLKWYENYYIWGKIIIGIIFIYLIWKALRRKKSYMRVC